MKKYSLILFFTGLSFVLKAQSPAQLIVPGRIDTVYSGILNEKRPVWIYTPAFDTSYFSKPGYPVLYVLDGDGYFLSLVTMIRQLAVINGNTVFPEMIIVGIPNTPGHRTRDLTPSASAFDPLSGGGEAFTAFMEKELIPYIDKNYATAPYRTLIGHSFGGLMVINTLLKHTDLFSSYVAIDPSMFYDHDLLLKQAAGILQQKNFKGRSLFLGIANTMNPGMDTLTVRKDTSEITHHIRSILKLSDDLKRYPSGQLRWSNKYYPDDDHASVPLIAEYDALRFIFAHHRFSRNQPVNQFFDNSYSATDLHDLIISHYRALSAEMGYQVRPSESYFNQLGYTFLQQKDDQKAVMFFQLNIDYYPGSFNAYDSMGDYYLARNDQQQAKKYFKKALSIKYRPDIKEKLMKLELKPAVLRSGSSR